MSKFWKFAQTFAVAGLLLSPLAACKPNSEVAPVVAMAPDVIDSASVTINKVNTDKLCLQFNKYVWLIDAARSMYVDGKLSVATKAKLDNAEKVMRDACSGTLVTTAERLKAAEADLVTIIWPNGTSPLAH